MIEIHPNMGKIILEFDSVEESQDARAALDGMKWKMAIWDLDQILRSTVKHGQSQIGHKEASDDEYKLAEKYRELIREILDDYKLSLEM